MAEFSTEDLLVHATERMAYGWVDSRVFGFPPLRPWAEPPYSPVLRTIVAVNDAGRFYPKFRPIEQDWDHVRELLTVTEQRTLT